MNRKCDALQSTAICTDPAAPHAPGSTARGWAELRSATPRQLSEGPAVARHGAISAMHGAMYRMESNETRSETCITV